MVDNTEDVRESEPALHLFYFGMMLPGRDNVRQPIPPPVMRFIDETGTSVRLSISEAQLLALLADGVKVLDQMRRGRGATAPIDGRDDER